MRSPEYVKCVQWLSEIWSETKDFTLKNSFEYCGIIDEPYDVNVLHSVLKHLLVNSESQEPEPFFNYVDEDLELEYAEEDFGEADVFDLQLNDNEGDEAKQNNENGSIHEQVETSKKTFFVDSNFMIPQ